MAEKSPDLSGAVLLNQMKPIAFSTLDQKVQRRVLMDITANNLVTEAANMLDRARNLLTTDVGYWEDVNGNVEVGSRITLALGILTGQIAQQAAGESIIQNPDGAF